MNCPTPNCDSSRPSPDFRWCNRCTAVVLRTGRPPVLPAKFVPRWLANLRARDETGKVAA